MIRKTVKKSLRPVLEPLRPGNIVMFHVGRCGSTALSSMLKQHKRMFWASEYYVDVFREWEKANGGMEVIGEMPEDAIDMLKRSMANALHRYYGFEIKPFHFRLIGYALEDFLRELEVLDFSHYIILDRKNRLRKMVSSIIAHNNRVNYHVQGKVEARLKKARIDVNKVEIDYDSKPLLNYLQDYDTQFVQLNELLAAKTPLKLFYEEDVQEDPGIGYRKICDFIGMEARELTAKISRTNPFPVKDMIDNFEEVEAVLRGTKYEWMLYD